MRLLLVMSSLRRHCSQIRALLSVVRAVSRYNARVEFEVTTWTALAKGKKPAVSKMDLAELRSP